VQLKSGEVVGVEGQHCLSDRGASNLLEALLTGQQMDPHKNLRVVKLNCSNESPLYLVMLVNLVDFWQKWYHFHHQN
jgi:hypothetical protein